MHTIVFLIAALLFPGSSGQQVPYLELDKAGAGFYGAGRDLPDPDGLTSVRIGVLGPGKTREGLHLRTAVRIALEEANLRGGYRRHSPEATSGLPYELDFHEDDGPWGVAAKQVVQMAYDDKVWAIIGGLDGTVTHIAELVVSKAWVPVISPSATDSSINYANVPWVFRAAPADSRQAEALLACAQLNGYGRLVVLSEVSREAHTGYLRLAESAARRHSTISLHLEYSASNPEEVVPRLLSIPTDALIIWGNPQPALRLMLALRKAGARAPILGSSDLATAEIEAKGADLGKVIVSALCNLGDRSPEMNAFRSKFEKTTGEAPSAIALYSYDVAKVVVAAIEKGGLNRARIRDRLSETSYAGLTGKIAFNMLGGNDAEPVLLQLQGNRWVRLE